MNQSQLRCDQLLEQLLAQGLVYWKVQGTPSALIANEFGF
jgi:hypothetical protein